MATQVILQMNVHCNGCARKIRRTARNVYGVEEVWASPETGVVVVSGNADVGALRSWIEYKTRRRVTVVSDGADEVPDNRWRATLASSRSLEAPDHWQMTHVAPSRYAPPPQGYPPYIGMAPAPHYSRHL